MLRWLSAVSLVVMIVSVRAASDGYAQGEPEKYRLALSGPQVARPGDEIAYVLGHDLPGDPPSISIFFTTPTDTTFVAVTEQRGIVLGGANVGAGSALATDSDFHSKTVGHANVELIFTPTASTGQVTIRVRIDDDANRSIEALANFRATGIPDSNTVITSVQGTTLPMTGTGYPEVLRLPWLPLIAIGCMMALLGITVRAARRPHESAW